MRRIFIILGFATCTVFALLFYQYHVQQQEAVQLQTYQTVMQEKMALIYEQAQDWLTPMNVPIQDERLKDDYQVIANFVLTQMIENTEARNAYLRELHALNWHKFLDIERLEQDRQQNYSQTKQMLQQVHSLTDRYQQQNEQRVQLALEQAKNLPIKARFRQQLADSLRESQKSDQTHALFELEQQVLLKAESIFGILQQYKWMRKNQTFMFYEDQAVQQFNTLYREIFQLNAQMEQIKKQNARAVEQKL